MQLVLLFDLRYLYFLKDLKLMLAVDNILSFKKWDTGNLKKITLMVLYQLKKINDLSTIFTEFNIVDGFKIGYELKIQNNIFVRVGRNDANSSFGLGFNFSSIKLDYTYVKNENNFFMIHIELDLILIYRRNCKINILQNLLNILKCKPLKMKSNLY